MYFSPHQLIATGLLKIDLTFEWLTSGALYTDIGENIYKIPNNINKVYVY